MFKIDLRIIMDRLFKIDLRIIMDRKKIVLTVTFTILLCILIACSSSNSNANDCSSQGNSATYQVSFTSTWSAATHPQDFPANPHFSGLIGATHNNNVTFWEAGELASAGIKNMAETGSKAPLTSEIAAAITAGTTNKEISGGGIGTSPGSITVNAKVTPDFPLVTLVSMLAPSPDWFVGISGFNLCENDKWVENKVATLYPYDAGTDSGESYTSANSITNPPENISRIEAGVLAVGGQATTVGTFTFTRQ